MSQLTHFLAALLGGAVVAAVLLLTGAGGDDKTTTVFAGGGADLANPKEGALSPREIYKRDAPGVVFITANVDAGRLAVRARAGGPVDRLGLRDRQGRLDRDQRARRRGRDRA